jgi:hypothetical protein
MQNPKLYLTNHSISSSASHLLSIEISFRLRGEMTLGIGIGKAKQSTHSHDLMGDFDFRMAVY